MKAAASRRFIVTKIALRAFHRVPLPVHSDAGSHNSEEAPGNEIVVSPQATSERESMECTLRALRYDRAGSLLYYYY